ncbi:MAG TPA: BTAD domain-containing putative transcriptional regulator [Jiangellaceae bacterium]
MGSLRPEDPPEIGTRASTGPPAGLWIGLLGPLEVVLDGRAVHITSDRLRAILAVLASSAGSVVSVDTIGEYVWGDEPPVNLRRTVQTWVARLRSVLDLDIIVSRPGGYVLVAEPRQVDVVHFASLLDAAATTADPDAERATIMQALGLWRGTPYDGVAAHGLESRDAPQLTQRYLAVLERATDLALDAGVAGEHDALLRTEVERHPLRESLWVRHLRVLATSGRSAEALAAYETIRRRLADELGVDPGAELQGIHVELLSPSAPPPRERFVARPRQLPADLEFVGRSDALTALDHAMGIGDPPAPGMVVAAVTGHGGAGKTSLAVRWAHQRQEEFPDGQIFIDLRGFAPGLPVEPAEALGAVLSSLGVAADQIPSGVDARGALYRTLLADRRTLVVLDNARDSEQVRPLLPGTSGRVIVTSRGALRGLSAREGARRVAVDELSSADAEMVLTTRFRHHGVTVSGSTVAELSGLCARLPLALVIAAEYVARHQHHGIDDLMRGLRDERDRLDALDDGDDAATSVRSVFSWSYAALEPEAARMFRLLASLLPHDFGPELAAAVAGVTVPRARRILDHLADVCLVTQSGGRYQFHDLLRMYGAERAELEDDEPELLARGIRCLDWYLHTLHNAMDVIKPIRHRAGAVYFSDPAAPPLTFDDPVAARAWCDTEHRALTFATRRAFDFGRHEHVWRLAWQLGRFLLMSAHSDELVEISQLGVAAARHVGDVELYISNNNLGNAYERGDKLADSVACFREALDGCRAAGDLGTESVVLMNLAVTIHNSGDLDRARLHYEAALDAARRWQQEPPDASMFSPNFAACLLNFGNTLNALGRYPEGIAHTEEALALARQSGNRIIEGMCLGNLAEALEAMGDYAGAEAHVVPAQTLLRSIGADNGLVNALVVMVRIMVATDRPDEARAAFDEGMAILRETDDPRVAELHAALAG